MGLGAVEIHSELVERARNGDQQAMFRLYKLYVGAMFNTCIRIVVNRSDAEDILQEAFISAFNGLRNFKGDSTFGAWLKRIVINKSLNHLRQKRLLFTEIENVHLLDEDVELEEMPEVSLQMIHDEIKELPDKARVVLNLFLLEGYQHKEIAGMLGISESTSKSQYQRARKLLQGNIQGKIEKLTTTGREVL